MFDPHPMVVFGGGSSKGLAAKIAEYLDIELGEVNDEPFPNGESMIRVNTDVRNRDVFVVQSICRTKVDGDHCTGVNDNLVELLIWIDTLRRSSAHRITAVIPYYGYARQDRKASGRTPITAKLVANMIQTAGAKRVLTMDLHSDQIQGFFDIALDHLNAGQIIADHFTNLHKQGVIEEAVVLSADVGGLKKADKYRSGMPGHFGIAVIDKRRHDARKVSAGESILGDDVKGKTVILLDDIISTAGTMAAAMDVSSMRGAKEIYIAATHGEFVPPAVERLSIPIVKQVCVTDTIPKLIVPVGGAGLSPTCSLPLKILSVSKLFGETIRRIHRGESISALLGKFG